MYPLDLLPSDACQKKLRILPKEDLVAIHLGPIALVDLVLAVLQKQQSLPPDADLLVVVVVLLLLLLLATSYYDY